jgi:hypothetical protein
MGKNIFFVGLILAASGVVSSPAALLGGLIYGFSLTHPFHVESERLAKFLLQASGSLAPATGPIAAIALPPQMAVPALIRNAAIDVCRLADK